jgi:hypothetical protein
MHQLNARTKPQLPTCFYYGSQPELHSASAGIVCDASPPARRSKVHPQCLRSTSEPRAKTPPDDALLAILGDSNVARSPPAGQPRSGGSLATRLAREAGLDRPNQTREMVESEKRSQFQRQIYRKWQPGDVYSPADLSGAEQKKWKFGRKRPQSDAFDILGINPVLEYKVRGHTQDEGSSANECRISQ